MRFGQNPAKDSLKAYQPARLGIALLSYIPSPAGYFEHSLEILKYQIASLYHSTGAEFNLLVFDNGSCTEVQAELHLLQMNGWIDFLNISRYNLGKIGALNWILGSMPNELICYSDSDVLFRQGWFENSLKILDSFPNPGLITAQPCMDDILHGNGKALVALQNDPHFQVGSRKLDEAVIEEYAAGVGLDPEKLALLKADKSVVATCRENGVMAVMGASHMQFVIPRSVAQKMIPLPVKYGLGREEDRRLNLKIDEAGFLHLSTLHAYVRHMGNVLDEKTMNELGRMGLLELPTAPPRNLTPGKMSWHKRLLRRLAQMRFLRPVIYRLSNFLFELYAR
jgi:hypothetical protein